ncbi:hypothetical protein, variant [Aphanomyces invadans]|uniref:Uncharacterized protein n=1 Tax=Aphanomyces invadans TaxID=157072 RepID=A0A024UJK8_9STRA|nr:hypothetical protein H310_03484 [Aphanomyces invadans]XP_008865580.1 hypothetical protein, variant [Aphanomyces invadans]ETW05802.1 hypothetical protein H310_03484 [Aphanomyces invadans]ETW05803.1 hypothetical protein, variant [Aphanomyces invadans]|eukprot:XP_008865579.1 hypothetical protein H310_03484 [Aphanomyces invadans]
MTIGCTTNATGDATLRRSVNLFVDGTIVDEINQIVAVLEGWLATRGISFAQHGQRAWIPKWFDGTGTSLGLAVHCTASRGQGFGFHHRDSSLRFETNTNLHLGKCGCISGILRRLHDKAVCRMNAQRSMRLRRRRPRWCAASCGLASVIPSTRRCCSCNRKRLGNLAVVDVDWLFD